jgi:hypothetical protein
MKNTKLAFSKRKVKKIEKIAKVLLHHSTMHPYMRKLQVT